MFGHARPRLAHADRPGQARCCSTLQRVVASFSQPDREQGSSRNVSITDQDNVSVSTTLDGASQWGEQISDLELHTEDALFHTWRPNCRVHYLKSGTSGVSGRAFAPLSTEVSFKPVASIGLCTTAGHTCRHTSVYIPVTQLCNHLSITHSEFDGKLLFRVQVICFLNCPSWCRWSTKAGLTSSSRHVYMQASIKKQ